MVSWEGRGSDSADDAIIVFEASSLFGSTTAIAAYFYCHRSSRLIELNGKNENEKMREYNDRYVLM